VTSLKKKLKPFVVNNRFLYSMYNTYITIAKTRKRSAIQKYGFDVLDHIHAVLEKEGIVFFLDFGTLLGIVREGRFIDHDVGLDIDVVE